MFDRSRLLQPLRPTPFAPRWIPHTILWRRPSRQTARAGTDSCWRRQSLMDRSSVSRLPDSEHVAFAVAEPDRPLAETLAGVVARHRGDSIGGAAGHVHLLEHHATRPQLRDRRLDVVDLPAHLSV